MARSTEAITADLDKILGTLQGLRTGFKLQRPLVEMKIGATAAQLVDRVINQVIDVHETIALVLTDLHERTTALDTAWGTHPRELETLHNRISVLEQAQGGMIDTIRDSLRVLT